MRLQKYLALCGVASRRKSEELIQSGIVKVNGIVIREMGFQVDPQNDQITVDNKQVHFEEETVYVLLNKPTGYVTTVSDQFGRKKVTDLVNIPYRIFPVGRLDYNTSGLLILTNDGDLAYKLTHPKYKVEKVYLAKIKGVPSEDKLKAFASGLRIENYVTSPAKIRVERVEGKSSIVKITIHEGRNRQVRKMCNAIGHPVIDLKRLSMGKISLGNLPLGQWRFLNQNEIKYLKQL